MLCARLEAERQGGLRFEISFFRSDGGVETQAVSAALPARDAARVFRLFREKLGLIDPGFGDRFARCSPHRTLSRWRSSRPTFCASVKSTACVEELAALIDCAGKPARRRPRLPARSAGKLHPRTRGETEASCRSQASRRGVDPGHRKENVYQAAVVARTFSGTLRDGRPQARSMTNAGWQTPWRSGPIRLFAASSHRRDRCAPRCAADAVPLAEGVASHRSRRRPGAHFARMVARNGSESDERSAITTASKATTAYASGFSARAFMAARALPRWYLHGVFA